MTRAAGFTLIEVLAAVSLFSLMFLAAAGTIGSLTAQQALNYQRAVAGSAVLLLADWHAARAARQTPQAGFLDNASLAGANASHPLRLIPAPPPLRFVGGEHGAGDAVLVFNPDPIADAMAGGARLGFDAYAGLVLTASEPSRREADSGLTFRQLSFWHGRRDEVLAGRPATVRFLARFLLPDRGEP